MSCTEHQLSHTARILIFYNEKGEKREREKKKKEPEQILKKDPKPPVKNTSLARVLFSEGASAVA